MIKIYVRDTSEKPVQLYHILQLYPLDRSAPKDQLVVSESYDEIIFNEPSAYMHGILVNNPYPKKRHPDDKSEVSQEKINRELERLEEVCEKLRADCDHQRKLIEKLDGNIRAIKSSSTATDPSFNS